MKKLIRVINLSNDQEQFFNCDPVTAVKFAYIIDNNLMGDFILNNYDKNNEMRLPVYFGKKQ